MYNQGDILLHWKNRVRRPQDGALLEALLISGKDIPGTVCAVQKTVSFRCLPLSGKDLPGTTCAVLSVTIASHVTTYAHHSVMFRSSYKFLQALYDVS